MSSSSLRLILLIGMLHLVALTANAQEQPDIFPVCEPPISVCGVSADGANLSSPIPECPLGYTCTCVPSCPACDDCAVQVCAQGTRPDECRTACDCEPGLGCFDGQCIAGFAPVYCCDDDVCPAGDQCQHRDGTMDVCGPMDPSCRERVKKVTYAIAELVEKGSYCRMDRDCVQIATSTECVGTCGAFVNKKYARSIQRNIWRLNRKVCGSYQEDGCPFATPACLATEPACVKNRCTGVPILPDPRPQPVFDVFQRGANAHLSETP